jgi:hypothetical protein
VNCGPDHIQCNCSSAYSGFNIQLNVSALLLEIIGHLDARYTANLVPSTAHIIQFTLCEVWSRPYTMLLQHLLCRLQYSADRISVAIGDMSKIQCALYCKPGAKYRVHAPVYAMRIESGHMQCNCSSAYLGYNIQLKVCALILEIYRHIAAHYTAKLMPNTAHTPLFTLCGLWSRSYTMKL